MNGLCHTHELWMSRIWTCDTRVTDMWDITYHISGNDAPSVTHTWQIGRISHITYLAHIHITYLAHIHISHIWHTYHTSGTHITYLWYPCAYRLRDSNEIVTWEDMWYVISHITYMWYTHIVTDMWYVISQVTYMWYTHIMTDMWYVTAYRQICDMTVIWYVHIWQVDRVTHITYLSRDIRVPIDLELSPMWYPYVHRLRACPICPSIQSFSHMISVCLSTWSFVRTYRICSGCAGSPVGKATRQGYSARRANHRHCDSINRIQHW